MPGIKLVTSLMCFHLILSIVLPVMFPYEALEQEVK